MAQVAFNQSMINQVTASGHVPIRRWNPSYCSGGWIDGVCQGWSGGYYSYSTASATIRGQVNASSNNVFVNGKSIATVGNSVSETETHNIPSGWEAYNHHNSGTGTVTGGSNTVYANGKAITMVGKTVRTHAGVNTTISSGSNNVHAN